LYEDYDLKNEIEKKDRKVGQKGPWSWVGRER